MVNNWRTTTGKHLNWIQPDKKKRVTKEEFDRIFAETFPEEIARGESLNMKTEEGKRRFVNELIENIKIQVLMQVKKLPTEWNGIELRQLIADHYANAVIRSMMDRKRRRDYNNVVLAKNLV